MAYIANTESSRSSQSGGSVGRSFMPSLYGNRAGVLERAASLLGKANAVVDVGEFQHAADRRNRDGRVQSNMPLVNPFAVVSKCKLFNLGLVLQHENVFAKRWVPGLISRPFLAPVKRLC